MSRLQVGGLALNLNDGNVVTLVRFIGEWHDQKHGLISNLWLVKSDTFCVMSNNALRKEFGVPACELVPLGDDQTQAEFRKELDELVFWEVNYGHCN